MNQASPSLKQLSADQLVCMNDYVWEYPIAIKLAYAEADNLLFGEQIYRTGAKLWLHRDLAKVVLAASHKVFKETGGLLVVYDGLRVVEAQKAMLKTNRVKENPQWLEKPRLLSPPGAGGHPRAMAVDVSIQSADGALLDMGTPFDFLASNPSPTANEAHRNYAHPEHIKANRKILDDAMMSAANTASVELIPLPQEWWDFRLPQDVYGQYAPITDAELPDHMKLLD